MNLIGYTIAVEKFNNYKRLTGKFKEEATQIHMDRPCHGSGVLSLASTHRDHGSVPGYATWVSQQEKRRWLQN